MKSYRKELWFNIPERRAFINITGQVEQCLKESGVSEGLILVRRVITEYTSTVGKRCFINANY